MVDTSSSEIERVNSQLQQLQQFKNQATSIANQSIPERTYGSPITASVQNQYIAQKEQARQSLIQYQQQEKQLQDYKSSLQSQQEYNQGYELGQKAAASGKEVLTPSNATSTQLEGYRAGFTGVARRFEYAKESAAARKAKNVSITYSQPKELSPIRVIDTNKGSVIVRQPTSTSLATPVITRIDAPTNEISFAKAQALSGVYSEPEQNQISYARQRTESEKANIKFFQEVYEQKPNAYQNIISSPISQNIIGLPGNPIDTYKNIKELISPIRTQEQIMKEAYGTTQTSFTKSGRGTMISISTPTVNLSKEAQFFKLGTQEAIYEKSKAMAKIDTKREDILAQLKANPVLTQKDIDLGNTQLTAFSIQTQREMKANIAANNEFLTKKIFDISPQSFNPYLAERRLYEIGVPSSIIKTTATGETFIMGALQSIKEHPEKAAINLAIGAGLTIATGGAGTAAIEYGLLEVPTLTTVGKIAQYGTGGLFALETGLGITKGYISGGIYGGAKAAGEITATDIGPFLLGGKAGEYGFRRYSLYSEFNKQISSLPESAQLEVRQKFAEAKTLLDIQPTVKSLNLKGIEGLPKEAYEPILNLFKAKQSIVVGGSLAQRTQLNVKELKAPGDIDVYIRGFFQKLKAARYASELKETLEAAGVQRVSTVTKEGGTQLTIAGKKMIEFKSFDTYLRSNLEQILPVYRTASYGITKTPEGIKVQTLSTQLQRKLAGGYLDVKRIATGKAAEVDIPTSKIIRESLLKSAVIQRTELGLKEVNVIRGNKNIFGETLLDINAGGLAITNIPFKSIRTLFGNFGGRAVSVEIVKSLPKETKLSVLSHELIHAKNPLWSEIEVRNIVGSREIRSAAKEDLLAKRKGANDFLRRIERDIIQRKVEQPKSLLTRQFSIFGEGGGKGRESLSYPIAPNYPVISKPSSYSPSRTASKALSPPTLYPPPTLPSFIMIPTRPGEFNPRKSTTPYLETPRISAPLPTPKYGPSPYIPSISKIKAPPYKAGPYPPKIFEDFRGKLSFGGQKYKRKKISTGYRTFVKKQGKIEFLPGFREKGAAERYGELFTLKTLRATFGVTKAPGIVEAPETRFKVDESLFRAFKIKAGKKIPLTDTFIQKQGKRLATQDERRAIQLARRLKL